MPLRSLSIAATGSMAQQKTIDTISNNIANVNTHSFKRSRASFSDLFYQEIQRAGSGTPGINQKPTGLSFGTGVRLASTDKIFSQGAMDTTESPFDLAIQGEGFYQVTLADQSIAYTRDGSLKRDRDGNLVTAEGYLLDPPITIDQSINSIVVDKTGEVWGYTAADPQNPQSLGRILLTRFINPAGLEAVGNNLYKLSAASGDPIQGEPGTEGFGEIWQGYLEGSNVDVIRELIDLISAQRAFEINGNSIQTADQILQAVNNLRR